MPIFEFDPLAPPLTPRFSGSSDFQLIHHGKVRVNTGSRLHFGFLDLTPDNTHFWKDLNGICSLPVRRYGGIGLMIPSPGISVLVELSKAWEYQGEHFHRAEQCSLLLQAFCLENNRELKPCRVTVEKSAPHHVGLGTGTQLALAVGKALLLANGLDLPTKELGPVLGRGKRSAIGLYGFDHGGIIVEGGKAQDENISPLVANLPWPKEWEIELHLESSKTGVHGSEEIQAFKSIMVSNENAEHLAANPRNALLGILPAIISKDLNAVRKFIFDMNMRTGKVFEPFEGEDQKRNNKNERNTIEGFCGQSSWGPACFGIRMKP